MFGEFHCTGSITIADRRIRCWRHHRPHGSQSLREGLQNSCNPVFIGLGQEIGVETFYNYLEKFGLLERTGIDINRRSLRTFLKRKPSGACGACNIIIWAKI